MPRSKTVVATAIVACALLAGCGGTNAIVETGGTSATTTDETQPVVDPAPDASYKSNCEYLLGDFTTGPQGYRFVADAQVTNTGNIGVIVELRASWRQAGGASIKMTRRLKVPVDATREVGVVKRTTQDGIDQIQSVAGDNCKAVIAVVDTYGDAR